MKDYIFVARVEPASFTGHEIQPRKALVQRLARGILSPGRCPNAACFGKYSRKHNPITHTISTPKRMIQE